MLGGKVVVDLGPGDDEFAAGTRNTVVDGGPGNDDLTLLAEYGASGPQHAEGGEGDDVLAVAGRHGAVTLSGGPGNDRFTTDGQGARASHSPAGPATTLTRWVRATVPATGAGRPGRDHREHRLAGVPGGHADGRGLRDRLAAPGQRAATTVHARGARPGELLRRAWAAAGET